MRKSYPDDLTEKEWEKVEPLLNTSTYRNAGRQPKPSRRDMFNDIFYLLRTGFNGDIFHTIFLHGLPCRSILLLEKKGSLSNDS